MPIMPAPRRPNAAPPERRTGTPDVSVCIANWNGRDLLRDCLTSLLRFDQGVRAEVIVAENGSGDGSAEMVTSEFPEVVLLRQPGNLGFARACNLAASAARGEHLFFLNNDTVVPPDTLRTLVDYARRHPEAGVVAPLLRDGSGRPQLSVRRPPTLGLLLSRLTLARWTGLGRRAYRRSRGRGLDLERAAAVEVVMGAALLVPRHVFGECGGWDETFTFGGEDVDLCTRVGRARQVVFLPAVEVLHHGRAASRASGGYAFTHTRLGMVRYLRKHGGAGLGLYKLLLTLDLPLHGLVCTMQWLWRRWRGRTAAADRSRATLRDLGHFLRHGLPLLWRA